MDKKIPSSLLIYFFCNETQEIEMLDLESCILKKNEQMENEINVIIEKVQNSHDYSEICSAFKGTKKENGLYEGGKYEEDIKQQWQRLEQLEIGQRLENILENVNDTDKKANWYYRIQLIQGRFKEKFKGWWEKQDYAKRKTCIICGKNPNCLERNWLTRVEFEKVKFGVNVYIQRGLKDPSNS